jgi:hypothetical protein
MISLIQTAVGNAKNSGLPTDRLMIAGYYANRETYRKLIEIKGRGRNGMITQPRSQLTVFVAPEENLKGRKHEERRLREKVRVYRRNRVLSDKYTYVNESLKKNMENVGKNVFDEKKRPKEVVDNKTALKEKKEMKKECLLPLVKLLFTPVLLWPNTIVIWD